MSRFIGIDFSTTSTGIAICEVIDEPGITWRNWQTFTLRSKVSGDSLEAYYDRIVGLARDIGAAVNFAPGDVIAIEGIAFAGKGRAVDRLHYAWHRTAEYLTRTAVEPLIITTNQVKQLATGRGNAQKDEVLLATERRLPQAQASNNDEADAVWIAVGASILAGSPVIDLPAAHMPKAWTKGKN